MKELLTAEEIVKVKARMMLAKTMTGDRAELHCAETIGDVYDVELPIDDVVTMLSDVRQIGVGEDVDYLVPRTVTKTLHTLDANCNITEVSVTPDSDQELTFQDLISPEYQICIKDWLRGKHNVLKLHADTISEAMNRQENKIVLDLLDAGAVSTGNEFTLDSNKTEFDFAKFIEMRKAIRRFGRKLVLITGCDVTNDMDLMDFNQDTQRPHLVSNMVDEWIAIDDYEFDLDGSTEKVIATNVAYLVAVSDSAARKPILFARRKTDSQDFYPDTTRVDKERLIISSGLAMTTTEPTVRRRLKKGIVGYEQIGAVLLNPNVVAKFTK